MRIFDSNEAGDAVSGMLIKGGWAEDWVLAVPLK
jgi:hypothetical protein